MHRTLGILIGTVTLFLGWAGTADACKKPHETVFELFDEAETVAVVRVVRAPRIGTVSFAVTESLKGRTGRLTTTSGNSSCTPRFHKGRTALVFLRADGSVVGHYDGYVETPGAELLSTMRAWAKETSVATRVAVLTSAIAGSSRERQVFDAASHLADEPTLLATFDAAAIAALATVADAQLEVALAAERPFTDSFVQLGIREVPAWRPLAKLATDDFATVTDPAELADTMIASTAERYPGRIAAMERCEVIHKRPSGAFIRITDGRADHYWLSRAEACRTGAPIEPVR